MKPTEAMRRYQAILKGVLERRSAGTISPEQEAQLAGEMDDLWVGLEVHQQADLETWIDAEVDKWKKEHL